MAIIDDRPSWDKTYMTLCYLIAMRSPDDSTKVGCVITTKDHVPVAMGYNGLPRGIEKTEELNKILQKRPDKYFYYEHAERNAIYNAGRIGVRMEDLGHTMYISWIPCADCARAILQEGVKELVIHKQGQEALAHSRGEVMSWDDDHAAAMYMLKTSSKAPSIRYYDGDIITDLYGFFTGKKYDFVEGEDGVIVPRRRLD